jgi:hypothetical protein
MNFEHHFDTERMNAVHTTAAAVHSQQMELLQKIEKFTQPRPAAVSQDEFNFYDIQFQMARAVFNSLNVMVAPAGAEGGAGGGAGRGNGQGAELAKKEALLPGPAAPPLPCPVAVHPGKQFSPAALRRRSPSAAMKPAFKF